MSSIAAAAGATDARPAAGSGSPAASTGDDFARSLAQWRNALVGGDSAVPASALAPQLAAVGSSARTFQASLQHGSDRASLWPDTPLPTRGSPQGPSSGLSTTAQRLRAMALGWATPGTDTHGDSKLLADTVDSIDWLAANSYTADAAETGNWWDWEIGTPLALNDAVALVGDTVSSATLANWLVGEAHWVPSVPTTGTKGAAANRVNLADVVCGRAVLLRDASALDSALTALRGVLVYMDGATGFYERDGFYSDGSFTQHGDFPYAGGYGSALLGSLANVLRRVVGTSWTFDASVTADWVRDSFAPLMWRGLMMDMVSGRDVSFPGWSDLGTGRAITASVLRLSAGLGDRDRESLAGFVKLMLAQDGGTVPTSWSVPDATAGLTLLADSGTRTSAPLVGTHVFGVMDRAVHRTRDWAVGIAMNSPRIADYETGNNENLRGWFTADGMTYLYTEDTAQFGDGFWCTVDPYRLPGTTVDTTPRQPVNVPWATEYHNPMDWVGGVALAHEAAAGMALAAQESDLTCRKSWFCLADRVVALGAGITAPTAPGVVTTVENRRLHGATATARLTVDGRRLPTGEGTTTLSHVNWAHLEGTGGYVFHRPVPLHVRRETRTGRYSDINGDLGSGGDSRVYDHPYVTLWLDHGSAPRDAAYAYSLLPTASARETAAAAGRDEVRVLANSADLQAVRQPRTGLLGANFFVPGAVSGVRARTACAVMLREHAGGVEVALSDPTQKQGRVRIELAGTRHRVVRADPRVTVERVAHGVRITADTAGATDAGRTVTLR